MKPPRARTRLHKNHENRSYASETQSIHCPWALQSVLMYLERYHRLLASLGSFCIFNLQLILAGSIWEGEVQGHKSKHSEKYDNFESCALLIRQWTSYEVNYQPVK